MEQAYEFARNGGFTRTGTSYNHQHYWNNRQPTLFCSSCGTCFRSKTTNNFILFPGHLCAGPNCVASYCANCAFAYSYGLQEFRQRVAAQPQLRDSPRQRTPMETVHLGPVPKAAEPKKPKKIQTFDLTTETESSPIVHTIPTLISDVRRSIDRLEKTTRRRNRELKRLAPYNKPGTSERPNLNTPTEEVDNRPAKLLARALLELSENENQ